MTRTYWRPHADGSLEFLGAFGAGHAARPGTPQAAARIIDIQDLDMRATAERLQLETRPAPPRLAGLPTAISKRLQARMPVSLPWAQIEGLVK